MPSKVTKSCQTVLFYHSHHVLERREGRVESNLEQEAGIDRGEVIHGDFGDRGVNKYFQRHIQLLTTWEELISPVACCCKACLWLWSVAMVCRHPSFIGEMWLWLLTVGKIYRWRHLLALMAIILLLCYLTHPKIEWKSS